MAQLLIETEQNVNTANEFYVKILDLHNLMAIFDQTYIFYVNFTFQKSK